MAQSIDISIITPSFNEAENIPKLYHSLKNALKDQSWELIIVDDNSPDNTWKVGRSLMSDYNNIRVIRRVRNRGLASACIEGVQLAAGQYTVVMDSDLQHDESAIMDMIAKLKNGADLAIGSRFAGRNPSKGLSSKTRLWMSRIGNFIANVFFRHKLTDPLTGFFALETNRFLDLTPKLSDSGFKILVDLLFVGQFKKIEEVGFQFRTREKGDSKLDQVIIWQFIVFLLEKLSGGLIPSRFISFVIVGGTGLFVHFSALFFALSFIHKFWAAQLFATLVALTSNFFLNNWLTFYDQRLKGQYILRGLLLFALFASVGIIANVGIADYFYKEFADTLGTSSNLIVTASLAGILIDTIWKYVMASRFVWISR